MDKEEIYAHDYTQLLAFMQLKSGLKVSLKLLELTMKTSIPKRKRLNKSGRLKSAKIWIKEYNGKNIISGYAKWFGVDNICAINELKVIGVLIPETLENQIIASHNSRIKQRRKHKENKKNAENENLQIDSDYHFAYIVGYTSGGFPYGLTHEEYEQIETDNEK